MQLKTMLPQLIYIENLHRFEEAFFSTCRGQNFDIACIIISLIKFYYENVIVDA